MGLVHRDIKPSNIMLTQQAGLADVVKILDFGLVQHLGGSEGDDRLTQPGVVLGTPGYMSPEQVMGVADVRSDIYSFGAVGYFLLTGQPPFGGQQIQQFLASQAPEPTPLRELRPEVPADLEAVIQRCLSWDPEKRFARFQLVGEALAACACLTTWSSGEAATWWRTRTDGPSESTPDSGSGI